MLSLPARDPFVPGLPTQLSLRAWAKEWRAFTVHLKPKTLVGYESLLKNQVLPTFGNQDLSAIDGLAVRRWIADLTNSGLSVSRTIQAFRLLSQLLTTAMDCGLIERNPCRGVKLPRMPRAEASFLTPTQVEALAAAAPTEYRTLIHLLAYGGLRWGEAAALRRGRVDVAGAKVRVSESLAEVNGRLMFGDTKTHMVRTVSIPRFLADELAQHLQGDPDSQQALVFTSPWGRPLRSPNFRRRVWWPALQAAGLPRGTRIHDLRHSCATMLIAQGAHPKAIQRHLGHASIEITMNRYGHLLPEQLEAIGLTLEAVHRDALRETA